ncbi:PREDICTED: uncharacterized protein LOC103331515 isoform X1 [Prunus mume]|uniref:Uncharacterized protein LOC103331515 isoform X1 n=1 Tax=Prunus mume TaxID=102107 RepID=A0ABM0NZX1_PRUMU|nr:PREDICTED: uncharacterized protein LOC103331515 isoform X1 [Prunus mume]
MSYLVHGLILTHLFRWMHDLQQKITIEAQIRCDKCRSKAMKIAVAEDGVISVAFQGPNRDKMVITGDGVDAVDMANSLRKKLGYADLVSVEEITEKKAVNKVEPKQETKAENARPQPCSHHPRLEFYIHDPPSTSMCTIL